MGPKGVDMAAAPSEVSPAPAGASEDLAPVVLRDHRPTVREMLRETWRQRALIPRLGVRYLVKRYSGVKLGRGWLFLRPAIAIFGASLLFGRFLNEPTEGVPYPLFLVIGLLGWYLIERTVMLMTRSFDSYRKVASRMNIPVLLVPVSALTHVFVDWSVIACLAALTTAVVWIVDGAFPLQLSAQTLLVVPGLLLALAVGFSVGLWLATLNGLARDVRLTVHFILQVWLYITPVFYAQVALPGAWKLLGTINPAAAPVELVKLGFFGRGPVTLTAVLLSLAWVVVLTLSGVWLLTRLSPTIMRPKVFVDDDEEEDDGI
jgi:homopolymeric O-antigen transport system permease protein